MTPESQVRVILRTSRHIVVLPLALDVALCMSLSVYSGNISFVLSKQQGELMLKQKNILAIVGFCSYC